jgi:hypothetical protein
MTIISPRINVQTLYTAPLSSKLKQSLYYVNQATVINIQIVYILCKYIIIIISLLMSPLLGHRPCIWITHKENES